MNNDQAIYIQELIKELKLNIIYNSDISDYSFLPCVLTNFQLPVDTPGDCLNAFYKHDKFALYANY